MTARTYAAHEAPPSMLMPVVILAIGSLVAGIALLLGIPGVVGRFFLADFLDPVFTADGGRLRDYATGMLVAAGAFVVVLAVFVR